MRKQFLFLATLCFGVAFTAYSQQTRIHGALIDSIEHKDMGNAVIILIRQTDTTLAAFTRADKDGKFDFKNIAPGNYSMQVSFPGFADYVEPLILPADGAKDFGKIYLTPQSKLLEEVIVRQNIAIRIKGDTIEYKADSFKTEEGASVKDLLKRFPGFQVDKDGKITAQGESVTKVLVDGEEFFSDDPAVVIENLRADAIDKVQTYNKKSDQAEFTGVDDGSRNKTVNLVLKEDKKKGLLGKIMVGGGTDERYSNQAMLNYFKGKKKLSIYGIQSNTGVTGLGWNDRDKFGTGGFDADDADVTMTGGFIMVNSSDGDGDFSDWDNSYNDEGIPRAIKAGAHFSNKSANDKSKINGNYSYKNQNVNAFGNSLTKYILPGNDSSYYSTEDHTSKSFTSQHLFNGLYDFKIDSMASLKVKINGKIDHSENATTTNTASLDENLVAVNDNHRTNTHTSDGTTFLASVLWRQKLHKKGRTLSVTGSYKRQNTDQDGYLMSLTSYFDGGTLSRRDTIDQFKISNFKSTTVASKVVYTEPAGKKGILEFNYAFARTASVSDRKSFDQENGKYDALNDLYSIKYGLEYMTNSIGAKYQYTSKKIIANIGSNVGISNYFQNDSLDKQVRHYSYTNLFPNARILYKFSSSKNLNFSYTGTPNPPSVTQLQPILENTNPLFVQVGNPALKQAFSHNFSLFYSEYQVLSGRNIWANASFSPQQNAIVSSSVVDAEGKTTMQFINTKGNYNYYAYVSYGFKIKKPDINVNVSLNGNGSKYSSVINGVKNQVSQTQLGLRPGIYKYKQDKYDVGLSSNLAYNFSNALNSNFFSQTHEFNGNYYITKRFSIGTNVESVIRQKTDAFQGNNNVTVWDGNVAYKIFKKKNGVFRFEVKDILKERRGYERDFDNSHISERNYNMLGRYGLLTFTWNFTKSPAGTKAAPVSEDN